MRDIPSLKVLCLRAIGAQSCSAESTFAAGENGDPPTASRLLRSFQSRPVEDVEESAENSTAATSSDSSLAKIPMERTLCIGVGSARRLQANEVDLNHPVIAFRDEQDRLLMEHGNPALDCLQSYIDSLVELGRMDDGRLGKHFFDEWKANVVGYEKAAPKSTRKRRRSGSPPTSTTVKLGSLSLYNCTIHAETIDHMLKSGMCKHLAVLDLTGIHGLTDALTNKILPVCVNLERLSIKNCRRLTEKSLQPLIKIGKKSKLTSLDVGGAFNISAADVLEAVKSLPMLTDLHASGLSWNDTTIDQLVDIRSWKRLSLGFSVYLTNSSLRVSFMRIADTLQSIALPFCDSVVDNTLLGMLGRNLPCVQYLDLRGNPGLNTLTGWYDGRASANLPAQALTVLGRYSNLSEKSVDETKKIHPVETTDLVVILDGTGTGAGIPKTTVDEPPEKET